MGSQKRTKHAQGTGYYRNGKHNLHGWEGLFVSHFLTVYDF